ncbi:MAG: glutamine amidotransferase [Mycobacteriales bacterium]
MTVESRLRIAIVLPDLLGTYGDRGNALVLAERWRARGGDAEIVDATTDRILPRSCDIYVIGGGEDVAEAEAARLLAGAGLADAVNRGAAILAVCAGLQILGRSMSDGRGRRRAGLGLLDITSHPGQRRSIGEVLARCDADLGLADGVLTGFENHRGRTVRGPSARPLARVSIGTGNGDGTDGAVSGRIVATYLHGPVLARNPALADHMLTRVCGHPLPAIDPGSITALRAGVIAAAHREARARRRLGGRLQLRRWNNPGVPARGMRA